MKVSNKAFKGGRKKDIIDYLNVLSRHSITYKNIDFKESLPESQWGYKIEELTFPVETSSLKHIRPEGFSNVQVIIDINVESQNSEWFNLNDPFNSLSFRSLLKGTNQITNKLHYLGFHIDRHSGGDTNEIHPLYHLQYLQNSKIKPKNEFDHGESLQLDVPRMMHFPMELILGVSTAVSNFAPSLYSKLIQDRQYLNLLKEYQERIWRPYINSIENYWLKTPQDWTWNPKLNCPYLV